MGQVKGCGTNPLKHRDQKQITPVGQARSGSVPQPCCRTLAREGAQSNSSECAHGQMCEGSGDVSILHIVLSAVQTHHEDYFIPSCSVCVELTEKASLKIDAGQDKGGSSKISGEWTYPRNNYD